MVIMLDVLSMKLCFSFHVHIACLLKVEEDGQINEDGYIVHDVEYVEDDELRSNSVESLPSFPNILEVPPSDIRLEIPQFHCLNAVYGNNVDENEPLLENEVLSENGVHQKSDDLANGKGKTPGKR